MIDEGEVRRVARLARLSLSAEETALYQEQLGRILEHMKDLEGLDLVLVEPAAHILGRVNALRDDEPRPVSDAQREAILAAAPATEKGCFKVPKVIG